MTILETGLVYRSFLGVTEADILCWLATPETQKFIESIRAGKVYKHIIIRKTAR